MNSRLGALAEGRWPDERDVAYRMDPRTEQLMEPPLHPSERGPYAAELDRFGNELESDERRASSPGRKVLAAVTRFLVIFFIGVVAAIMWQSYGDGARRIIAGLLPALGWLAPPAAPAPPAASLANAPPDQIAAISRSLAVVRQSVDKLTADITKLQAARQDTPPVRTSGSPAPAASATSSRKPGASGAPGPMTVR